ncbi:hypothetical protein [Floridanema evergladense]|uniref:Uncharacterized protein n=1 Tax=Floridaenema evergladense BLCC-F167 TaxID=3153639 RepID=A0ABV4WW77_9CYAN
MNYTIKKVSEAGEIRRNSCIQLAAKMPAIKLVTNRRKLRATDRVNWENFGKEFDFISSPLVVYSDNGVKLKVSSPGTFLRLNEGSEIKGKFPSGDKLLFLEFSDGAITIDFATPIFGVGTQIQRAFFGAFTGVIESFDRSGSLGKFSVPGNTDNSDEELAPFIGVLSKTPNISRITLYVPENGGYGFTINGLDLVTRHLD